MAKLTANTWRKAKRSIEWETPELWISMEKMDLSRDPVTNSCETEHTPNWWHVVRYLRFIFCESSHAQGSSNANAFFTNVKVKNIFPLDSISWLKNFSAVKRHMELGPKTKSPQSRDHGLQKISR